MASSGGGFGDAFGNIIGGAMGSDAIAKGQQVVGGLGLAMQQKIDPFINFGTDFMPGAQEALGGANYLAKYAPVKQFGDFMKDFKMSTGAQYQMDKALGAADTSAAARGSLLSGANLRSREEIAQGVTATDMASQYAQTLAGNQQAFGQLNTAGLSQLAGVGVGTQALGLSTQALTAQMNAQAQLAASQAKSGSQKGGGIGSMMGGLFGGGKF